MSNDALPRRGLMLVLSSPSGAGKTTISRALLDGDDALELSVSATTRAPREGEVDGVHYHFISDDRFRTLIDEDGLLEWANVFNNAYGTRALRSKRRCPKAATCCSTSTGREPSNCARKCRRIWSACSCCHRRWRRWKPG